ncbi:hypothetical protein PHLCEN_2v6812, partial [Hermanssonia centrifuga]
YPGSLGSLETLLALSPLLGSQDSTLRSLNSKGRGKAPILGQETAGSSKLKVFCAKVKGGLNSKILGPRYVKSGWNFSSRLLRTLQGVSKRSEMIASAAGYSKLEGSNIGFKFEHGLESKLLGLGDVESCSTLLVYTS